MNKNLYWYALAIFAVTLVIFIICATININPATSLLILALGWLAAGLTLEYYVFVNFKRICVLAKDNNIQLSSVTFSFILGTLSVVVAVLLLLFIALGSYYCR